MNDAVIVAIITSAVTLIGVWMQNSKTVAIIETKLNALTKSVEKHNNFAEKIPVIEEKISAANHRIDELEKKFD